MIKLTLPYPPSVNSLYATFRGRRIVSAKGREYKRAVHAICFSEKVKPFGGNVSVVLRAYRPRKIGDIDNVQKAVFDSVKGSCFNDDRQIVEILAQRFDDAKNPRIEIEIKEID